VSLLFWIRQVQRSMTDRKVDKRRFCGRRSKGDVCQPNNGASPYRNYVPFYFFFVALPLKQRSTWYNVRSCITQFVWGDWWHSIECNGAICLCTALRKKIVRSDLTITSLWKNADKYYIEIASYFVWFFLLECLI